MMMKQVELLPPAPPRKRANTRRVLTVEEKLHYARSTNKRQWKMALDLKADADRMFRILAAEVGAARACQLVRGVIHPHRR